ncbi:Protein kinase domain-containing protein [Mycena venus]|uniref:Protein kinase domain-containing protein n=1 Tax=Mycena venus TaxID=2733690 RepID=A0A8H6YJR7_9AGAR|nr:Protein kinase domain-containing protein [Mycena venus]
MAQLDPVTTFSRKTILDCIEKQWVDHLKIPQNLVVYAFSLPHPELSQGELDRIRNLLHQWGRWDILEGLANFHSVVKSLFEILKNTLKRDLPGNSHPIAEEAFRNLSQDVQALHDHLVSILRDTETYQGFLACRGDLAQQLLDLLQDLLDSFPESSSRPRLSKALERLSRVSELHPTCFPLSGLQKVGQQVAAGAFGDIWKGLVRGQSVSVKIMRLFRDTDMKDALQEFGREALIWRQLSHPNLLPFFGVYYLESRLCLVSPWMSNGHVLEFLVKAPPDTDRVSLILDVAMGLEYLHGKHVVHGDLKGMNILVTPSRRACVADFGLSSIVDAMTLRFTNSTGSPRGGTGRYQAPELLSTDVPNHYGSDVYAFGCVCYEMLTGKAPFFEIPRDVTVIIKVLEGLRPSRPETIPINDNLWSLLQDCWKEKSCDRPNVSQIIKQLVGPAIGAKMTESSADWDETFSSKSRRSFQEWPLLPPVTVIERRIFGDDVVEGKDCYRMYENRIIDQNPVCSKCFPEQPQQPVASDDKGSRLKISDILQLTSLTDRSRSSSSDPPPSSSVEVDRAGFYHLPPESYLDDHCALEGPRWPEDFNSMSENYIEMLSDVEGMPTDLTLRSQYLMPRSMAPDLAWTWTSSLQAGRIEDFGCVSAPSSEEDRNDFEPPLTSSPADLIAFQRPSDFPSSNNVAINTESTSLGKSPVSPSSACTHCRLLKMKCDFGSRSLRGSGVHVDNTCRRCRAGGHVCIVEGRKARSAPK